MRIAEIEIDDSNETHLTSHGISVAEVQQVFANRPEVRRNRKGRAGTHVARGETAGGHMNDYDTIDARAAVEADFDRSPADASEVEDVSTVVSVRLRGGELAAVERAAKSADMPLSTFIRQAALGAASPLDVRAASARVEAIQAEASKLVALLHGEVA